MLKARIPPPVYGIAAAALMWWLDRRFPVWRWLHPPSTRAGWLMLLLGFGIDAGSIVGFLKARTTVNPMRITAARELVTTGLFRWSRNPMYLGLIIALIGWAVVLGSVTPLVVIPLFARILAMLQIVPEEAALEARFGDAYTGYRQRVNRWIGRRGTSR